MDRPDFDLTPDKLTREQRAALATPLKIAPGHGMRVLTSQEQSRRLRELGPHDPPAPTDVLLVYEPPRRGFRYVVSADVSSGTGLDRSVVDVTRVGTLREIEEQVAQFVTDTIDPSDLGYVIDAIGRLYRSNLNDLPALVAVECNGMGISTQDTLLKVIGYPNLYIWEYWDAVNNPQTTRYGWYTNQKTRPIMLNYYTHAIRTVDPRTGLADYRINSPHTVQELADFQTPGPLWLAAATDGAHDDCIMAGAIGVTVATRLHIAHGETIHDARRRLSEEAARASARMQATGQGVSYQSTDASYDAMMGRDSDLMDQDPEDEPVHYVRY